MDEETTKKVVRYYSINQEKLDEALWGMIDFIAEVASSELKAKAAKKLGYRKIEGEPPLVKCDSFCWSNCHHNQRDLDIKWYKGETTK